MLAMADPNRTQPPPLLRLRGTADTWAPVPSPSEILIAEIADDLVAGKVPRELVSSDLYVNSDYIIDDINPDDLGDGTAISLIEVARMCGGRP
jgi:hypothetical protein